MSPKNAIKAFISGLGGKNLFNSLDFCLKKKNCLAYFAWKLEILSLKNAIKALYFRFWGEKSCKFQTFCARSSKNMFQKSTSASVFLAILPFLDPIFTNFLPQSAWSLEKFEKSADLGPFPAKIELLPLEIPRKLVFFWKFFEKLAKKGEI